MAGKSHFRHPKVLERNSFCKHATDKRKSTAPSTSCHKFIKFEGFRQHIIGEFRPNLDTAKVFRCTRLLRMAGGSIKWKRVKRWLSTTVTSSKEVKSNSIACLHCRMKPEFEL